MVHIESRKTKKNSEYEIFLNIETNDKSETLPLLRKSLRRKLSYVRVDSDSSTGINSSNKSKIDECDDIFDDTIKETDKNGDTSEEKS